MINKKIKIIVFYPHVKPKFNPKDCFRANIFSKKSCTFDDAERIRINNDFMMLKQMVKNKNPNVLFFDQNDVFCPKTGVCTYVDNGIL